MKKTQQAIAFLWFLHIMGFAVSQAQNARQLRTGINVKLWIKCKTK
jgi:hypothetical protein